MKGLELTLSTIRILQKCRSIRTLFVVVHSHTGRDHLLLGMQTYVNESAPRGKIVIASKDYLPGELVLEENPIMVVPKEYAKLCKIPDDNQPFSFSQSFGAFCWYRMRMSGEDQTKVMSLFGPPTGSEDDRLRGLVRSALRRDDGRPVSLEEIETFVKLNNIMRSSRFNVDGDQVLYAGMSSFAHSCDANCHFTIEPRQKTIRCRVTKPIRAGEEMTVSYCVDLDQQPTNIRRQKYLEERWFTCHCPRCDAAGDDTRQFDCSESHCKGAMVVREPINKIKHFLPDLSYTNMQHVEPHLLPCSECRGRPHIRYQNHVFFREETLPNQARNTPITADGLFDQLNLLMKSKPRLHDDKPFVRMDFDCAEDLPRCHALSVPIHGGLMKNAVFEYLQFMWRFSIDQVGLGRFRSDVHAAVNRCITAQEAVTKGAHVATLQVLLNVCRACIFTVQQLSAPVPVYPPKDAKTLLQRALRMLLVLHGREEGRKLPDCIELDKYLLKALEDGSVCVMSDEVCAFCEESPAGAFMKRSRCGACKKVMYCSAGCQKAHWKLHKKNCGCDEMKRQRVV